MVIQTRVGVVYTVNKTMCTYCIIISSVSSLLTIPATNHFLIIQTIGRYSAVNTIPQLLHIT